LYVEEAVDKTASFILPEHIKIERVVIV